MNIKEIKLLLFDLDDTLLYFDDYWKRSMYEAFETYPLTKEIGMEALFPVFLEKDEELHEHWLRGKIDGRQFRRLRFIQTLARFDLDAEAGQADDFERWFWSVRAPYIPYDKILNKRLARWGRQYRLGMLTNGTSEDQYDKLERMGLQDLFNAENVLISDELGVAKPNRQAYEMTAQRLGVAPEACLFIGDSWANDVAGPLNAGMKAVWLNRKSLPQPQSPVPTAVVTHLEELEGLLFQAAN